jgi:hypothetical protein
MKFSTDWAELLKDDDFQQDLVFFSLVSLMYIFGLIEKSSFDTLSTVIIMGDAVKKLGRSQK